MTYDFKLTSYSGATSVDFSLIHPSFSFRYTNPLITIPTPMDDGTTVINNEDIWKVVTININMSTQIIQITAKESGGLTVSGAEMNIASPTTIFEKMLSLCRSSEKKKLYVNSTNSFGYVDIVSYTASIAPGAKDIVDHNISLQLSMNI